MRIVKRRHFNRKKSRPAGNRKLFAEQLERRELLAADGLNSDFFAGASFLSADGITRWTSAMRTSAASTNSTANETPVIPIDLPTQYDPIAKKIGQPLFDAFRAAQSATTLGLNNSSDLIRQTAAASEILVDDASRIGVEIVASTSLDDLRSELSALTFEERASFGKMISGSIDPLLLDELAQLPSVNFVRPIFRGITNVGAVENEADEAMRSDIAKTTFGLDGTGIKIGVLSDSYDKTNEGGGEAGGISTGDLPGPGNPFGRTQPVQVLKDFSGTGIDEGRAMIELIHDVAPGASLAFRTAFEGPVDFAAGILELANAGSDIIVDDVTFFAQPFFQDGVIAQAANQVVSQGIPFFSSAGNQGRESYESVYRTNGATAQIGQNTYTAHDFDPGPGVDNFQHVAVAAGQEALLSFQWDQPFASSGGAGSANDMDIFAFDQNGFIVAQSVTANIGQDAVEILRINNPTGQSQFFDLVIGHNISAGGPQPGFVKYYHAKNPLIFDAFQFNTFSGTLFGHHQAIGGAGIAAADYRDTPEFGTSPAQPQDSTSAGGVPIFFDTAGNRLAQPVVRSQPIVTGPDNTNTTFFIPGTDPDNDGNPNFAGTSAAAPHIAAVAALMMEAAGGPGSLSPAEINNVLSQTALDMLQPGFDFDTGAGFVDAEAAIAAVNKSDFYFAARFAGTQRELYRSDGTPSGTQLVKNLGGNVTGNPTDPVRLDNGFLLFASKMPTGERELFRTKGTSANTKLVKNLAGNASSFPEEMTRLGDQVIFSALLPDGQRELYTTKGSASNTKVLANLRGNQSSNPTNFEVVGNQLYFVATTNQGQRELFVTDGTTSGTRLVKDLSGSVSALPNRLTAVGNKLFFTATTPTGERELFVSSGTAASTKLVKNLSGATSSNPRNLTAVGNRLFFSAELPSGEVELFVSNGGTAATTKLVTNIGGSKSAAPQSLIERAGRLYFVATLTSGQRELMVSNGTAATTSVVKNLSGATSANPKDIVKLGSILVFSAQQANGERELFRSNGTSAGTKRIKNLSGSASSDPQNLTVVGDRIAFSAKLASGQRELFISDLSESGTKLVKNLNGSASSNPGGMILDAPTSNSSSGGGSNAANAQGVGSQLDSPLDVSGDQQVTIVDALRIVNFLGRQGRAVNAAAEEIAVEQHDLDVNGDGHVTAGDALVIINHLNEPTPTNVGFPILESDDEDESVYESIDQVFAELESLV